MLRFWKSSVMMSFSWCPHTCLWSKMQRRLCMKLAPKAIFPSALKDCKVYRTILEFPGDVVIILRRCRRNPVWFGARCGILSITKELWLMVEGSAFLSGMFGMFLCSSYFNVHVWWFIYGEKQCTLHFAFVLSAQFGLQFVVVFVIWICIMICNSVQVPNHWVLRFKHVPNAKHNE